MKDRSYFIEAARCVTKNCSNLAWVISLDAFVGAGTAGGTRGVARFFLNSI
jgi:hypothetical protein